MVQIHALVALMQHSDLRKNFNDGYRHLVTKYGS